MFRAKNKTTGEAITILDAKWIDRVKYLRSLDRMDRLVCPGCEQPVRVRAGRTRRWHFAHKHLQNCAYGYESPAVLNTRAVLYKWLVGKFGDSVQIEKEVPEGLLPRHIDCWVETEKGSLAYWIIGTRMKPQKRNDIWKGFANLGAQVNYVFTIDMLLEDNHYSDGIHLTTTEREFASQTDYDDVRVENGFTKGTSLHYLNPETEVLVTYRELRVFHPPQLFQGRRIENEIASVNASLVSGELVHPGEHEQLELLRQERIHLDQEREERERMADEYLGRLAAMKIASEQSIFPKNQLETRWQEQSEVPQAQEVEAVCVFCGQITDEYWYLNRADNTCKCRECYHQGRY